MRKFTITHWDSDVSYGTTDSRDLEDEEPIDSEIINKLFELRGILGVMSVRQINKVITWELKGQWYPSIEIDRMLKLKAFA